MKKWNYSRFPLEAVKPTTLATVDAPNVPMMPERPTVSGILAIWGPWRCCMGLLGECEDGVPIAARFYSPQLASHFVFYGQDDVVLATLVEPLLYSMTIQGWDPALFKFAIFSDRATEWAVTESEYSLGRQSPYKARSQAFISQMAGLIEQRNMGRFPLHSRYLLVLHDLGHYWPRWERRTQHDLYHILSKGHEYGINVVATIRYKDYDKVPENLRALLRQKVYGYATQESLPNTTAFRQLSGVLSADIAPYQAWVRSEGKWMRYTAPILE